MFYYENPSAKLNRLQLLNNEQKKYLREIDQVNKLNCDLVLDCLNYFIITINNCDKFINVEHICYTGYGQSYSVFFTGKTAKYICKNILHADQLNISISAGHASYLGRELIKSEFAVLLGQKYIQD